MKHHKDIFFEIIKFIAIVFLVVIPIRLYVAQPFIVRGASMEPTFENGDYLIIDELTYRFIRDAQRDEVIVFRYPLNPSKFFIKRIVGLPHETVTIENGIVFIERNGNKLRYEHEGIFQFTAPDGVWNLKAGEYFVMGDNREASSDSRSWGPLPEDFIVGRALLRLWPIAEAGYLPGYQNSKSK